MSYCLTMSLGGLLERQETEERYKYPSTLTNTIPVIRPPLSQRPSSLKTHPPLLPLHFRPTVLLALNMTLNVVHGREHASAAGNRTWNGRPTLVGILVAIPVTL